MATTSDRATTYDMGTTTRGFFGHPRGLSTLFFTEMWERFSYYGMRAFLILYMVHALGFDDKHAGSVYGTYTASVWAAAIVGGIIADRWLGQYRSVLIGGIIIALGHFTLAFHPLPFFYAGLALIVVGTGTAQAERQRHGRRSLYDRSDARRDAGFSIFYMGINLGAALGPFIAGYLAQRVDWHFGFACAGVGMTLGLIQYVVGTKASRTGDRAARGAAARGARGHRRRAAAAPRAEPTHGGFTAVEWKPARRDGRVLRLCRRLLGRLRAGRVDAQPVRRPIHARVHPRLQLSVELVPDDPGDLRHRARAGVRVAVDGTRRSTSRRRPPSSRSACFSPDCHSCFCSFRRTTFRHRRRFASARSG